MGSAWVRFQMYVYACQVAHAHGRSHGGLRCGTADPAPCKGHAVVTSNSDVQHGLTALHKASVVGQLACLRVLLEFKADVARPTTDGLTAMHLAAWKGQREALRLLASQHADVNAKSADGGTPLHEAVRSGDLSTVQMLLQLGATADTADKVLGPAPLRCTPVGGFV